MEFRVIKVRVRVLVEPDDHGFHAFCPDLKGLHVGGETEEEALENVKQALTLYLWSLIKHEEPIPVGVLMGDHRYTFGDLLKEAALRISPFGTRQRSYVEEITLPAA